MNSESIIKSIDSVTKKWTKQRKAEERSRARSRSEAMTRTYRVTVKDAAFAVMEKAYMKASSGNTLPASARQIMYAARRHILKETGRSDLKSQYVTQALLPEYMALHAAKTANWNVTYDARGHFAEPHTKVVVPLGTLDVRGYLAQVREHAVKELEAKGSICVVLLGRTRPTPIRHLAHGRERRSVLGPILRNLRRGAG